MIYAKADGRFYLVSGQMLDILDDVSCIPGEVNLTDIKKLVKEKAFMEVRKDAPLLKEIGYADFDTDDGRPVIVGDFLKMCSNLPDSARGAMVGTYDSDFSDFFEL